MSAKEKKDQPVGSVKETDFHEDVHMLFRRDAGPGRAEPGRPNHYVMASIPNRVGGDIFLRETRSRSRSWSLDGLIALSNGTPN